MYVQYQPDISKYRGFIPTFLIAAILVLLASTKWFKRIITFGAVATVVIMTMAFAFPENFEYWKAKNEVRAQAVSFETFCLKNPLVSECQRGKSRKEIPTSASREAVSTYIAPTTDWSPPISIPTSQWFRMSPGGKILVKTWDGKVFEDEPGKPTWLGDSIRKGIFQVKSREQGPVVVTVATHPK